MKVFGSYSLSKTGRAFSCFFLIPPPKKKILPISQPSSGFEFYTAAASAPPAVVGRISTGLHYPGICNALLPSSKFIPYSCQCLFFPLN